MKYRKDFVTNSSSSSYTCEICGRTECGMDLCLSDAEMVNCVNGHTVCRDELLSIPTSDLIKLILMTENCDCNDNRHSVDELEVMNDKELDSVYFELDDAEWDVPEALCPICRFVEYSESDLSRYLEQMYGVSRAEVFAKVRESNRRRKKLYENEYITEVCRRFDLSPHNIVAGWKEQFGTYAKFRTYLQGLSA